MPSGLVSGGHCAVAQVDTVAHPTQHWSLTPACVILFKLHTRTLLHCKYFEMFKITFKNFYCFKELHQAKYNINC